MSAVIQNRQAYALSCTLLMKWRPHTLLASRHLTSVSHCRSSCDPFTIKTPINRCASCAGDTLSIKQLLDRVRRSVQGAFANSELPTGEMTVMAGLTAEDEPKLMPFGFAVHDESFFRVPEWHGLQVRSSSRA